MMDDNPQRRMNKESSLKGLQPQSLVSFAKIRSLVAENVDLNEAVDDEGNSLLQAAVLHNCCKGIIKYLVSHGADLHFRNKSGANVVQLCCIHGKLVALKTLIHLLKEVDTVDDLGNSYLHYACHNGCLKMVIALLGQNASIVLKNNKGNTALHEACYSSHKDTSKIVSHLITEGSSADEPNSSGELPLHIACREQSDETMVNTLIKTTKDIQTKDNKNQTCLHHAVINKHPISNYIIGSLIREGIDVTVVDTDGDTAFEKGLKVDTEKVLRFLVIAAKHIASKRQSWSRWEGKTNNFSRLFKLIEDTPLFSAKTQDSKGNTIVHHINQEMEQMLVKLLLFSTDSEFNIQNNEGVTPLHIVAEEDKHGIYADLVDMGGFVTTVDLHGRIPFMIVLQSNNKPCIYSSIRRQPCEIISFLEVNPVLIPVTLAPNNAGCTLLHFACRYTCVQLVQFLADKGEVNHPTLKGKSTPLHKAAKAPKRLRDNKFYEMKPGDFNPKRQGIEEIVEALLDNGADITAENEAGFTPLAVAFMAINNAAFEKIICFACRNKYSGNLFGKMDINAENCNNETPLLVACKIGCCRDVVHMLLEMGADCRISRRFKTRPFQYAATNRDFDTLELLLSYFDNNSSTMTFQSKVPMTENAEGVSVPVTSRFLLNIIAEENDYEALTVLLKSNVTLDVNKLHNGNTMLHTAVLKEEFIHPLFVSSLLKHGADVHKVNHKNQNVGDSILLFQNSLNTISVYHMVAIRLLFSAGTTVDIVHYKTWQNRFITHSFLNKLRLWDFLFSSRILGLPESHLHRRLPKELRSYQDPLSLKHCCAIVIRTNMKPNAWVGIEKVTLPKALKSFVICRHEMGSLTSTDLLPM